MPWHSRWDKGEIAGSNGIFVVRISKKPHFQKKNPGFRRDLMPWHRRWDKGEIAGLKVIFVVRISKNPHFKFPFPGFGLDLTAWHRIMEIAGWNVIFGVSISKRAKNPLFVTLNPTKDDGIRQNPTKDSIIRRNRWKATKDVVFCCQDFKTSPWINPISGNSAGFDAMA